MPAILQPTPEELKQTLINGGWVVSHEDSYNWLMVKGEFQPLAIPKRVKTVPYEILYHCLTVAGIGHQPIVLPPQLNESAN